jgi:hypothetical protein
MILEITPTGGETIRKYFMSGSAEDATTFSPEPPGMGSAASAGAGGD